MISSMVMCNTEEDAKLQQDKFNQSYFATYCPLAGQMCRKDCISYKPSTYRKVNTASGEGKFYVYDSHCTARSIAESD